MAKVPDELKKKLIASGKWPDFVREKTELIAGGVKSSEATRQCLDKFLGAGAPGSTDNPATPKQCDTEPRRLLNQFEKALLSVTGNSPAPKKPGIEMHLKADFAGKECSTAESLRWVARNVRAMDVEPKDAPDAAAWNLLCDLRQSPMLAAEFWKSMWTKTIEKGDLENGADDGKIDGTPTIELIGRLTVMRETASRGGPVEGRRVHDPEVAGSIPASATNQPEGVK